MPRDWISRIAQAFSDVFEIFENLGGWARIEGYLTSIYTLFENLIERFSGFDG